MSVRTMLNGSASFLPSRENEIGVVLKGKGSFSSVAPENFWYDCGLLEVAMILVYDALHL